MALTRPELAVLLAYAKLSLYSELLDSTVPTIPISAANSSAISPKEMSKRYEDALHAHRLRRGTIATHLTNSMINSWRRHAHRAHRRSDRRSVVVDRGGLAAVRNSYGLIEVNSEIDGLDNKI